MPGVLGEEGAPRRGDRRRRTVYGGPEGLHHEAPIRLLVVAGPDLPDLAAEAEERAGEGERRPPLPGPGLGGEAADPGLGVVVGLRDRGVGLVTAGRADPLVLVVDPGRRAEGLLEAVGPVEGGRPPLAVDVEHRPRDIDEALGGDLLEDEVHREQGREVLGADRLAGAGVEGRRGRAREVRHQVVPGGRHLGLLEHELVLANGLIHGAPPCIARVQANQGTPAAPATAAPRSAPQAVDGVGQLEDHLAQVGDGQQRQHLGRHGCAATPATPSFPPGDGHRLVVGLVEPPPPHAGVHPLGELLAHAHGRTVRGSCAAGRLVGPGAPSPEVRPGAGALP